jgi:predicted NAD/FAD-binding protein
VTYYSNRLQRLPVQDPICVSLNQTGRIRASRIIENVEFHHPVYTRQTLHSHRRLSEISGRNRTSYCGAYWGYGFHEDGVTSGLKAVEPFGATL